MTVSSGVLHALRGAALNERASGVTHALRGAAFNDRASGVVRKTRGTPFDSRISNYQIAYRALAPDRLVNIPIAALRSQTSFDLAQTRVFNLYTIPAGKNGMVLGIFFEAIAADSVTVAPAISVGIASGEADILPSESMLNFDTVGDVWSNWLVLTKARGASATEVIKLNVVGATATKLLADVHLIGFEY
jgi:hypothetical protein